MQNTLLRTFRIMADLTQPAPPAGAAHGGIYQGNGFFGALWLLRLLRPSRLFSQAHQGAKRGGDLIDFLVGHFIKERQTDNSRGNLVAHRQPACHAGPLEVRLLEEVRAEVSSGGNPLIC